MNIGDKYIFIGEGIYYNHLFEITEIRSEGKSAWGKDLTDGRDMCNMSIQYHPHNWKRYNHIEKAKSRFELIGE